MPSCIRPLPRWPKRHAALALAALLVACGSVHAQYKWTDRDGHTGYGDQPPTDATAVERLANFSIRSDNGDALAQLPFELRRAVRNFPVVLYTRSECPPCDQGRAYLKSRNVPFAERQVASQADIEAFRKAGGADALPALGIGRQMLRGYESGAWSEALATAGYPQDVPLPRNWQWPAPAPLAPPPPAAPAPTDQSGGTAP